jgi:hypothetical protein
MRDLSMEHAPAGLTNTRGLESHLSFQEKEIELLQELAKKVAELAARPIEQEKSKSWTNLNDLNAGKPLVFCDPENGWNEIIGQEQLKCTNKLARVWEMALRKEVFWAERMKDDRVIEPYFNVAYNYIDTGYGISEKKIGGENDGSFVYEHPIRDYEKDFHKLKYPEIIVDFESTNKVLDLARSIFENILEVRLKGSWWWTLGMTWEYIKLRGLENLMLDVLMYPAWVHKLMEFLSTAFHKRLDYLEANKLLSLNTEGTYVGSGGFGWTEQLPSGNYNPEHVRLMDMWGFGESQETLGLDPNTFNEMILPYQKTILDRFGLNCYGCCEPLDQRWEFVKSVPRLRRVSVSPWADVKKMKEYLGNNYVMSLKPSPTPLATEKMNEETVRKELADKLDDSMGCNIELIMKDNHTLGKNPDNAVRWCEIAREEIDKRY